MDFKEEEIEWEDFTTRKHSFFSEAAWPSLPSCRRGIPVPSNRRRIFSNHQLEGYGPHEEIGPSPGQVETRKLLLEAPHTPFSGLSMDVCNGSLYTAGQSLAIHTDNESGEDDWTKFRVGRAKSFELLELVAEARSRRVLLALVV